MTPCVFGLACPVQSLAGRDKAQLSSSPACRWLVFRHSSSCPNALLPLLALCVSAPISMFQPQEGESIANFSERLLLFIAHRFCEAVS
jgi:hypothetical protein